MSAWLTIAMIIVICGGLVTGIYALWALRDMSRMDAEHPQVSEDLIALGDEVLRPHLDSRR